MKPLTKKILITSGCLTGAGIILAVAGFFSGGWPGFQITKEGLRSASLQKDPYVLEKTEIDSFSGIDLDLYSEADIELLPSDDGRFYLEYTLGGNYAEPVCDVSNGRLTLTQKNDVINGVYFFGPMPFTSAGSPVIRVYIPAETVLSEINIYSDYGDLIVDRVSSEHASICLDYGDLQMDDTRFADAGIELSGGDLNSSAFSADSLTLTCGYGDVSFDQMSVINADITMEDGDLALDAYGLETLTGISEYGDTDLTLHDPYNSYSFNLVTEYGDIKLPESAGGAVSSDEDSWGMSYRSKANGVKKIEFTSEDGNININSGL